MSVFCKSVQAENFKVKKNLMFLTLCFFPIVTTLAMTIFFVFYDIPNTNFWLYYGADIYTFYALLYPILLSFIAFEYVNLEIKNGWHKQLFCLPIEPHKIYLAKCTMLLYYYTISIAIAYISFMLSIYLLNALSPEINESLQHYDSKYLIDLLFLKSYIIMLPLVFFQYAISLAIPKVWLPCTVALLFYVAGLMSMGSDYFYLSPNASAIKLAFEDLQYENIVIFDKAFVVSIIYTLLFFVIGFLNFKKSKSKINS